MEQQWAAQDGMEQRCAARDGAAPRSALPGAQPCAAEAQPFLAVAQLVRDVERAAGPVAQAFSGPAQMLRLWLAQGKQVLTRTDEP
jgi:hypothetical protein